MESTIAVWTIHTLLSGMDGGEGKRADSSSGSGGRVLWSPPSLCGLYIPCRVFLAAQAPGVHRRCSPPCPPLGCTLNTYLPEHTQ